MSSFSFADFICFRMSEKTANPLEQFVLLAKTAKVTAFATFKDLKKIFRVQLRLSWSNRPWRPPVFMSLGSCLICQMFRCPHTFPISISCIPCPWMIFNLQDLENGPHASHLALLNTFAYGNYRSFMDNKANLPELTEVMVRKLRLLTMVRWHLFVLEFDSHENT